MNEKNRYFIYLAIVALLITTVFAFGLGTGTMSVDADKAGMASRTARVSLPTTETVFNDPVLFTNTVTMTKLLRNTGITELMSGAYAVQVTPGWIKIGKDSTNPKITVSDNVYIGSNQINLNGDVSAVGYFKSQGVADLISGDYKVQVTPSWVSLGKNGGPKIDVNNQGIFIGSNQQINLNGNISLNGNIRTPLSGSGNAYACLDATGRLYRSQTVCN